MQLQNSMWQPILIGRKADLAAISGNVCDKSGLPHSFIRMGLPECIAFPKSLPTLQQTTDKPDKQSNYVESSAMQKTQV